MQNKGKIGLKTTTSTDLFYIFKEMNNNKSLLRAKNPIGIFKPSFIDHYVLQKLQKAKLTLYASTQQNGQIYSNNSLADANKSFECV